MQPEQNGYTHETVQHGAGEYTHDGVHINGLEGYWSMLKKGIRSKHIHVSGEYLKNYAKEFEYRYNNRTKPESMFSDLLTSFP